MTTPSVGNPNPTSDVAPADPSLLTTQSIWREIAALKELIGVKLDGLREKLETRFFAMDKAIELIQAQADKVPSEVDLKVGYLQSLHEEKFVAVKTQFAERDTRSEQERRDSKVAIDAALAAQKEAAARQEESNQKAIDKAEAATSEKIAKLEQLFTTRTDALADKIDDLKGRQERDDGKGSGIATSWAVGAAIIGWMFAAIGVVLAIIGG